MFLMQTINEEKCSHFSLVVIEVNKINVQNCKDYGYDVVAGAVDVGSIQAFCDRYSSTASFSTSSFSYLPTRDEYRESKEVQNLLSLEVLDTFAKELNKRLVFQLVEARLGSSQIGWHVDNFAEPSLVSDSYYSMIIALGDVGSNAGCFEVVSGSHKVNRDSDIINQKQCNDDPHGCFKYFDDLVEELAKTSPIYQFRGKRGDIILWSGSAIHRGAKGKNEGKKDDSTWLRNSLFVHFTLHDLVKPGHMIEKLGYGDNLYFSTHPTSDTTEPPSPPPNSNPAPE